MDSIKELYFAGGCFWGVQEFFSRLNGVVSTHTGYANGETEHPTYQDVCYNHTGHAETVRVEYDPTVVDTGTLVDKFFKIIDPMMKNRQGNDIGAQYRTGVYYTNPEDREKIEAVFAREQQKYKKPMATELLPLEQFFRAEEYHQDYLKKNPGGYCHINLNKASE